MSGQHERRSVGRTCVGALLKGAIILATLVLWGLAGVAGAWLFLEAVSRG